jgi:hypothetical protein
VKGTVILGASRTAFGRFGQTLSPVNGVEMLGLRGGGRDLVAIRFDGNHCAALQEA